ncbi:MAG TPA: phosphate acyltransferase PlsX [Rhodospirillales bacterium]|nr:phosphate acyltransferase PlsX [Rhodospirillales bacterium]
MTLVIALDAMGGDSAPGIVIDGAAKALRQTPGLRFLLFGDEARVAPLLGRHPDLAAASELRHTEAAVAADAKPSQALRQGRRSSMRLAIDAVKAGEAAAAVSAGNTGALMAMAKFVLKTLPGIDRPAIATLLPTRRDPVVMLDLGANVDCGPEHLFQFAVMGEVYARAVLDIDKPSVGLLNVGTEEVKGDSVVRAAAALIRDSGLAMDYYGFVEGGDVFEGRVHVVVTDGFTGNVALKITEGTARLLSASLRSAFRSSWRARLGYLLARPALERMRQRFDPRLYNGAMFLGLNGVVVKSHGGTDAVGFAAAISTAIQLVQQGTNERIIAEMNAAGGEVANRKVAAS